MNTFAQQDKNNNGDYIKLLTSIAKLSGLFSDSDIPYINYRVAENVFCRAFGAENLSRSDTAFDAKLGELGVGLKTFICTSSSSLEKVAEFNTLSSELSLIKGIDLARKLAILRNERIALAQRLYGLEKGCYHIVARRKSELLLFETDYSAINVGTISDIKDTRSGLQFTDGINEYSFNRSKSTLYRRFVVPQNTFRLPIDIIEDPYTFLLDVLSTHSRDIISESNNVDEFVILPLYSTQKNEKLVPEKSGLNQWNARGRKRDLGEVYVPIPQAIHNKYPTFFPPRSTMFTLQIPTGECFVAKVCQQGGKALMTNPNKSLSDWLLRRVFSVEEGELLTYARMNLLGFDSVIVYKDSEDRYRIDKAPIGSYERFIALG